MTIRQRISILIVLVFAALAIVGGFAVIQARQSATQVRSVTEGVVPSAMQSMALMTQLKDVQIATLNMVAATDAASVEQMHANLTARKSELQAALASQSKSADSPAQVGLIKQAQESLQNYFASIDDTARFKLAGNNDPGRSCGRPVAEMQRKCSATRMDAVPGFIQAEGGAIELDAADAAAHLEQAAFRVVITLPGKFAVARERAANELVVA